jgi:hypothetical protein
LEYFLDIYESENYDGDSMDEEDESDDEKPKKKKDEKKVFSNFFFKKLCKTNLKKILLF